MNRPILAATVAAVLLSSLAGSAHADSPWPALSKPAPAVGGGSHDAAVVVGIENYPFVPGVPGAERNAKDWYAYLSETLGVPIENIALRVNAGAARESILNSARRAAEKAGKQGTLWFVFIGHGAPSLDGKDGLLVGVDAQQTAESLEARSVKRNELLKVLSKSHAKRIAVVLDACFSGRDASGKTLARGLQPLMVVTPWGTADPRMAVLTAAKGDQVAGPLPGADRPAFSYLVLGGLRGWAAKAKGAAVTAGDLWHYASHAIEATVQGREQTPDLMGQESADMARSAGEKGPDLAKIVLALAGSSGGGGFTISAPSLGAVPQLQAPGALGQAPSSLNFGNVDVAALGEYNAAYELDKDAHAKPEDKAAKWRQLAQDYPQYADMANKRAAQWDAFAAQWKAAEEAKEKRLEAMYQDWGKLKVLLGLTVVSRPDKVKWSRAFLDAYFKSPGIDPKMAKALSPYAPAKGRMRRDLEKLALRPMTEREREWEKGERAGGGVEHGKAGIEWVRIPGGSFMMGSSDYSNAQPHQVTVQAFQMAKALVTNKQYKACVDAGVCSPAHYSDGTCWIWNSSSLVRGNAPDSLKGGNQPVVCVDWNQARAFSKWVGGRLPSEAEWEYAARSGGKDWKYPWGNEGANCGNAVIRGCGYHATAPVCSKPSGNTKQGLCDMAGNAFEWVEDWYHGSYNGAPTDGSAWVDPAGSLRGVIRGGSWARGAGYARSANRYFFIPGLRFYDLGFRPAR